MQLNKFTDYALRILMYISQPKDTPYTIAEIAKDLHVSQNHLVKIVHFMAKQNWLITSRGKGGGIRLNPETANIGLGLLVRTLQGDAPIVECNTPPCVFRRDCGLKSILDDAMTQFYQHLDHYTVANVIQNSSSQDHNPTFIELINL
ncbi:RrF2 family transcriptional regulator [Acinetobacter silvestris]|uniref:Transcriptional regulator n=1 Tax=Acinetobacter silvestris TaxID=1977882 RepID=A0A1Y3CK32_9GAMM|nr:Rrf2 family transcriptional regulator [Acinetobacter silvestris]OTG67479.1 transcriptional regulator [Acinetobacter silvestris]